MPADKPRTVPESWGMEKETPKPNGLTEALLRENESEVSDWEKVLEKLLDPEHLLFNTELSEKQILAVTTLGSMAFEYELEYLANFLIRYMSARVSKKRGGRNDVVKMWARQEQNEHERLMADQGRFSSFFRRRPPGR